MQAILLILVTFDFNSSKISTITSIGSAYIGSSTTYTVDSDITGIIIVQTANDDRSNAFCTVSEGICNEMLNQTIHRSGYASQLAIFLPLTLR